MTDILFDVQDAIATITINRPEAFNAMKTTMWKDVLAHVREVEQRADIRVLVLKANGANFCSGADVTEFAEIVENPPRNLAEHWMAQADATNPLFVTIERLPQPVVASTRGIAAGGGFALAVSTDLLIASETSRFFAAQIKLGAIPDSGLSFNLRRAIGIKKTKQYCFLGDEIDAATADRLGLVNWVVPDDRLEAETDKLARRLAAMPSVAIARTKASLNKSFRNSLQDHFLDEALDVGACVSHPDFSTNVRAFMERKRSKK